MKKNLTLLVLPIVLFCITFLFGNKEFFYDPSYIYLFNGLNLAYYYGEIGHYDNPGTPVIIITSILIKLIYFFRDTNLNLLKDVLLNPNIYLSYIVNTLNIINCLLFFLLGVYVYRVFKNLSWALFFQLIPFFSQSIMLCCFYSLSPEAILLPVSIIFLILLIHLGYLGKDMGNINLSYTKKDSVVTLLVLKLNSIVISFLVGLFIAIKLTAIPYITIMILFIKKWKDIVVMSVFLAASFLLFTLPIHQHYGKLFNWIKKLFFHSGQYGTGNEEIININNFKETFFQFIQTDTVIFVSILCSLIALIFGILKPSKRSSTDFKLLSILFLYQIFIILIVFKHYDSHYFVSAYAMVVFSIFLAFDILEIKSEVVISICVLIALVHSFTVVEKVIYLSSEHKFSGYHKAESNPDQLTIYSYGSCSQFYALDFGDMYSNRKNTTQLRELYSNQYFYNQWGHYFYSWSSNKIDTDSLKRINKTLVLDVREDYIKGKMEGFSVQKISKDRFIINLK
jgi:hypothetical protein